MTVSAQPSPSTQPNPFQALGLSDDICRAVQRIGYAAPTPIQAKAIPKVLAQHDLLGCAQTGTGKTAAFALPIIQRIASTASSTKQRKIVALILAPTRELAAQIGACFERYGGPRGPRSLVIFGGVNKKPQIERLRRGVDVLVATPGRLLDLMGDGEISLQHVHTFVLDEADRMLDMGFIHDVRRIIKAVPTERQTLLFSATMPKEIQELADRTLKSPVKVAVDPVSSTREPIEQGVFMVDKGQKTALLTRILDDNAVDRALVFTRTKHGANRLVQKLDRAGIRAAAIHGNKSQSARTRALEGFKSGELRALVATDIAARGIDIKSMPLVINFDLPNEPESYVHRVGRTGRAGEAGTAISFCDDSERPYLRDIEKLTRQSLSVLTLPSDLPKPEPSTASTESRERRPRSGDAQRARPRSGRGRAAGSTPASRSPRRNTTGRR